MLNQRKHSGVIGVESAIVLVAFVIVAAAIAFVVLDMGFATTQQTKTVIISSLSHSNSNLQVSGKILGMQCWAGGSNCGSFVSLIAIPMKLSGGEPVNLDYSNTVVRLSTNSIEYNDIYNGTINSATYIFPSEPTATLYGSLN